MRIRRPGYMLCVLACACFHAGAQSTTLFGPPDETCIELNRDVLTQVAVGQLREAESALTHALSSAGLDPSCQWIVFQNMAVVMSRSGRLEESESYGARALAILDRNLPPDDILLLRPLQVLFASRMEQGKVGAARQAFQRMKQITISLPSDRALFHGTAAALLHAEGHSFEAEAEYRASIEAWDQAGEGDSSNVAAVLNGLGDLYASTGRFDDADRTLNRALSIYATAPDADTADHLRIRNSLGVLYARRGQWKKAEEHLLAAVNLGHGKMSPAMLEPLLSNYAQVLRATHQTKQAQTLEARAARLFSMSPAHALIDASQLLAESEKAGK